MKFPGPTRRWRSRLMGIDEFDTGRFESRFTTSSVARLSLCTSSCLAVALSPALRTIVHSWSHSGTSTLSCLMGPNSSSG